MSRKDHGALSNHLIENLVNGNITYVARQLSLLHPLMSQQICARARAAEKEELMVVLTPALWGQARRSDDMEQESTRLLRTVIEALAAQDVARIKIACEAARDHLEEINHIMTDDDFHMEEIEIDDDRRDETSS